ncbi:hypothetical protein ASC97_06925 [Rhizobium sp. Root1203]|nr:hypothetical protein ASC97_06925 [Rhizobium sp. Root1203]
MNVHDLVCFALIMLMTQSLFGLASFAAKVSESTAKTSMDNAAKCRKLTGSCRHAGETSHMRAVNRRRKVEKKMKKLGCPIPIGALGRELRASTYTRSWQLTSSLKGVAECGSRL